MTDGIEKPMAQPKQSSLENSISGLSKSISALELEIAKLSPQKDLGKSGDGKIPIQKSFSELWSSLPDTLRELDKRICLLTDDLVKIIY